MIIKFGKKSEHDKENSENKKNDENYKNWFKLKSLCLYIFCFNKLKILINIKI